MQTANRRQNQGSSLAYVLFIVVVTGIAATGMINSVGDEIQVASVRHNRTRLTYAGEGALEIAKGRLKISAARENWLADITAGGLMMPTTVGATNMSVSVTISDSPNGVYDSYRNPTAKLVSTATAGSQAVMVSELIKEATATDFAQWWNFAALGDYVNSSTWNTPVTFMPRPTKGKVFIDTSWMYPFINLIDPRKYGVDGPYFQGKIYFGGNQGGASQTVINNMTGLPDAVIFEEGYTAGATGSELPVVAMDASASILDTVDKMIAQTGASVHDYNVSNYLAASPNTDKIFQLRIRGSTYDWRVVTDTFDASWMGGTPWNLNNPLPDAIVVRGYPFSVYPNGGGEWNADVANFPKDVLALNGQTSFVAPEAPEAGLQVWCDNRAVAWEPANEIYASAMGDAWVQGWGQPVTLYDVAGVHGNNYYDGFVTIASSGSLEVMGSLRATDFNSLPSAGGDMLGLVANGAIFLRNDSFKSTDYAGAGSGPAQLGASDRIGFLDAFCICGHGEVHPVYAWEATSVANMSPPMYWRGAKIEVPRGFARTLAYSDSFSSLSTDVISGWHAFTYKVHGFQNHELDILPGDMPASGVGPRFYTTGYDPGYSYDERGLKESPPGFPKMVNVEPSVVPGTWGVK